MHFSEGGYDAISSKLFRELNADTYYLEYDTARAGGFEPLKDLPKHKSAVLGLISTKLPELEQVDALKKRIDEAAGFVAEGNNESKEEALQRLCLSPQCGFASHSEGTPLCRVRGPLRLLNSLRAPQATTSRIPWSLRSSSSSSRLPSRSGTTSKASRRTTPRSTPGTHVCHAGGEAYRKMERIVVSLSLHLRYSLHCISTCRHRQLVTWSSTDHDHHARHDRG